MTPAIPRHLFTPHLPPHNNCVSIMFLGGFVPRRFTQLNRDPWWMFFIFSVGAWIGEYPAMQIKYNARDLVLDPHRYVWSHLDDHH
ncbi:hypothetical protein IOCL2690_000523900 [Leishmania lindenbergi]|uniref:Uncharacterized protein n=1 Tax=Leishmania lindenbergi TaxID=651832 RepID=A0AAW3AA30_9TRYP